MRQAMGQRGKSAEVICDFVEPQRLWQRWTWTVMTGIFDEPKTGQAEARIEDFRLSY